MGPGVGTALADLSPNLLGLGMAAASYIPSKEERALKKQVEADRKRLAGGAGGMSEGLRQQAQAAMASNVQAQSQQALAQLARGNAMGGGESGINTAKQLGVIGAGQQAMMQGQGQLREQDLMAAAQQRAQNAQLQQYLIQSEQARRQAALGQANTALGLTPSQQQAAGQGGMSERQKWATAVGALAGVPVPAPGVG